MEPHPEPEEQVLQGPQPGRRRAHASKGKERAGAAREGGLGWAGGRGGSPRGPGRVGVRPGRLRETFSGGSAGWRCPGPGIPPSAAGLGAQGAGTARLGGARRGGNGCVWARPARVNVGDLGRAAPARVSARPPGLLGLLEKERGPPGHVGRGAVPASLRALPASPPRDRGLARPCPSPDSRAPTLPLGPGRYPAPG